MDDFLAFVETSIAAYNARMHRALGKRTSPIEAWQNALRDGFEPLLPSPDEAADLFRPYELRRIARGEIALHGKRYFARCLEHLHGEEVRVGYDIHDPSRVWMRDLEDQLVAIAELDGNSTAYFPPSRIEQAREERARAQLKRLEAKAMRIALAGPIECGPTPAPGDRAALHVQKLLRRKPAPGEGRQAIWAALRSRAAAWSTPELVLVAGCQKRTVNLYIESLVQAGYVERLSQAGSGGTAPSLYRLAENTGPRAPVRQRDGVIFDLNEERAA